MCIFLCGVWVPANVCNLVHSLYYTISVSRILPLSPEYVTWRVIFSLFHSIRLASRGHEYSNIEQAQLSLYNSTRQGKTRHFITSKIPGVLYFAGYFTYPFRGRLPYFCYKIGHICYYHYQRSEANVQLHVSTCGSATAVACSL